MKPFFTWLLFVCLCSISYAQTRTCKGSLGDPVVKIDFGAGPDLHSPDKFQYLTKFVYTYINVEDSLYTIKNTTQGDHTGGWYETLDHTGNPGGYMMVVNASKKPTEFYRDTVRGLCPGTTYEFAAWIFNLLIDRNGIRPNITFMIKTSTSIDSIKTGPLENGDPNWRQYGLFFSTAANSGDVILIMKNNAPGGGGNDLALDDITFRACGPLISTSFTSSSSSTQAQNACEGDVLSYPMSAKASAGYNDPAYQWQVNNGTGWTDIPGATNLFYTATFTPAVAGTYNYRVATAERNSIGSQNCRVSSNPLTVNITKYPSTVINGSARICENDPIALECDYGDTYSWTGPNGFTSNRQTMFINKAKLTDAGTYSVVIKRNGCVTNTSITVTILPTTKANAGADVAICFGSKGQLHASGGVRYEWTPSLGLSDPNIADPVVAVISNSTFVVKVIGANGCFTRDTVNVNVIKPVTAYAGNDRIIDEGDTIKLDGRTTGVSSLWSPATALSSTTVLDPVAKPTDDITYTLFTTSGDPCNFTATDQVFIKVYKKVIIPNTFTPNNDGVNDTWNIVALNTYPNSSIRVFDRKGDLMYQAKGYNNPWDGTFNGKQLPAAVYYYKIDLGIGRPPKAGWVTIIR